MLFLKLCLFLCVCFYTTKNGGIVKGQGTSNMVVEEFYWCKDVPVQKVKFFLHIKDLNPGQQLVDINLTIPYSVGNDERGKGILEFHSNPTPTSSWIPLITLEGELCKTIDKYMGDFWHDLQTAIGMMRQSCPWARGSYHATKYRLNFQKLRLQTFPLGKTKVTLKMLSKDSQETLACVVFILSNNQNN